MLTSDIFCAFFIFVGDFELVIALYDLYVKIF